LETINYAGQYLVVKLRVHITYLLNCNVLGVNRVYFIRFESYENTGSDMGI